MDGGALSMYEMQMSFRAGVMSGLEVVSSARYCRKRELMLIEAPLEIGENSVQVPSGVGVLPPRTLRARLVPDGASAVQDTVPQAV